MMFGWPMYHRGSGVQIDANHVLTAQHVEGLISGWEDSDGCDLAIIESKTDNENFVADKIASPKYGDTVHLRGKPFLRGWSDTKAVIVGDVLDERSRYRGCPLVLTSRASIAGMSGGPVYDEDGNLVGIIARQMGDNDLGDAHIVVKDFKAHTSYVPLNNEKVINWIESVIGHKLNLNFHFENGYPVDNK